MADPWRWWDASTVARIISCPVDAVTRNWPLIADALEARGIYDRDVCLGVLPTVSIETARTFEPIHEYGTPANWAGYEGGALFAGRGFPQLTHLSNYRNAGADLGVDLVGNPDLAMDPQISADILAWFWATKGVPSKDGSHFYTMVELCREHDWNWVRRVFQGGTDGLDRLIAMASALDTYATPTETPMPVTYNLDIPIQTQDNDWDCAQQSTMWALQAAGRNPGDDWMEQDMIADGVESAIVGLTRGDGSLLAEWVTREYADPGANGATAVRAYNVASVGFDDVRSIAGTCPVLIGGHNWGAAGHWTGIRRSEGDHLVLANPGGTGPIYGQQTLNRQEFDQRGPWSMVVLQAVGDTAPIPTPAPAPSDPKDAELVALRDRVGGLEIAVAHLADILAGDRLHGIQEEARAIREQFMGKRPAA